MSMSTTSDTRIASLTHKAHAGQWSADAIDWKQEPVLPAALPRAVYIDMVSQLYHAELATLEVLAGLSLALPEADARAFVATQIQDEQRHAGVYRRYLERLGDIAPLNLQLGAIFRFSLASRGPHFAQVVALNVVMEHEALAQQRRRIDTLPCPLFRDVNRAIVGDESRHAGFGVLYLARALPAASFADRMAVATWVKTLWAMWCEANEGRYTHAGAEVLRLERAELAARWDGLARTLSRLGLGTRAELAIA